MSNYLSGKVSSSGVVSASGAFAALQGPNTPPPGSGNGNGNNGGGNNSGGNGNGSNGNNGHPRIIPPTPGQGNAGSNTPTPITSTVPGSPLPDLNQVRKSQPTVPKAPKSIHADLCDGCDPGGGTPPPAGGSDPYFETARVRPQNEVGERGIDLGSRNFNWSLPLVSLPGRAGLDLDLGLVYNSLVWTRQGNAVMYNADWGFPSPGFSLGVPKLQGTSVNQDEQVTTMLLIMPSGERIELKQVGTSFTYESSDSSYVQATDTSGGYMNNVVVRAADGTQYTFVVGKCTQIKDRNGNYITISYNQNGQLSTLVDTLGRTVTFNYVNDFLDTITQTWNGQTHVWATFGYGQVYFSTNFPGLSYLGPQGYITVLTQVGLADGTRYNFSYTSFGQVYKISHYAADNHLLNYTGYNLPGSDWQPYITAQSDCPRFTEQHDWAENWNNNQEAITYYSVDPNSAGGNQPAWTKVGMPDGTYYREFFSTANDWTKGLTTQSEVWLGDPDNGGVRQKYTTTLWTQDDTSLTYQKNPRPYDMNTHDIVGNSRHTDISYTSYGLPYEVREYSPDGSGYGGFLRRTYTDYHFEQAYIDQHILGLVSAKYIVDETNTLKSKVSYDYDRGGEYLTGTSQPTIQHDTNYNTGFLVGRGNLTDVWVWDATDDNNASKAIRQQHMGYDTNGSVVFMRDALWDTNHPTRQVSISYADSFSAGGSRNTFAYPTTVTDPDGYMSTSQYDYDFGAVTLTQDPKGASASMTYDAAGRISQVTNGVNSAHKRWVYNPYGDIATFTNVLTTGTGGSNEAFAVTYFDGAGRVRSMGGDLPNSSGGYFGAFTLYDIMGRPAHQSNTEEMNNYWAPTGEDAVGWIWTDQTYDWKGRPLVTTFTDGHTRSISYNACGCAGSEVATITDERGRARRLTKDSLGRLKTVEELNWDGSVYSNANYTYDALDHLKTANQLGVLWRTFNYDGYGRLSSKTTPEQGQTNYSYFADGTVQTITDARQATTTFAYNNRHLPTGITYGAQTGVSPTANVSFGYDEVGNRTSMSDGLGSVTYHYNQLSQMDWETRSFSGLGSFTLNYAYNLSGELTNITNPWSVQVTYSYDAIGRPNGMGGANYAGVSSYVGSIGYRAFGGVKQINYGNGKQLSVGYDYRLRMTSWDVGGVIGYNYAYNYFNENSDRVTFASQIYDHTLDRSYDYDQVGRMWASHSGREARWHTGQEAYSGADGPYAENYAFDQAGDIVGRNGWGAVNSQYNYNPQFWDNKMNYNPITGVAVQYDLAGNLINDGQQTYNYDATGQQTFASLTNLTQGYDGDGVRVKKTENGATTYYLRSSVLGGQVICEINGSGGWSRGYVYLGGQMVAIQANGVNWVHQDPVTKSQRVTDVSGNVVSWVELDPWSGETGRSSNQTFQPHRFTSYERDANGSDEAMMRRYEGKWGVFAQPDPTDESYDLTNPQSLHRYMYTQNDPVNSVDPSGLKRRQPDDVIRIDTWAPYYHDDTLAGFGADWGLDGDDGFGGNFDPGPRGQETQNPKKPNCIANAVPGGKIGTRRVIMAAGHVLTKPPYGTDLSKNSHDGIHVLAASGSWPVTALPAMRGTVLHYGYQTDGGPKDVSVIDILLDTQINGQKYVLTLKDMAYKKNAYRPRDRINPGSTLGTVTGGGYDDVGESGLHVTLMPLSAYNNLHGNLSGQGRLSVPYNQLMDAAHDPKSPFNCSGP